MPRAIADDHPAVLKHEQVTALPGHVFEVSQAADDSRIFQYLNGLLWSITCLHLY